MKTNRIRGEKIHPGKLLFFSSIPEAFNGRKTLDSDKDAAAGRVMGEVSQEKGAGGTEEGGKTQGKAVVPETGGAKQFEALKRLEALDKICSSYIFK